MTDFDAQDQIFPYLQTAESATWNHIEVNAQDQIFSYLQTAESATWNHIEVSAQDQIFSYLQLHESAVYNSPSFPANDTMSQLFTGAAPPPPAIINYYAMRAIDPDCPILTYVSWVATGSPDITGAQYAGPRCGISPLSDITITAKWQE